MTEMIQRGDAKIIPAEELDNDPVWYIPHHGVYHPKKPDKLRVVFDCSARYQGVALNDYLLQGLDLTNSLIGVLISFRRERFAVMCDVERMFHQFKVDEPDQDYLRFIWTGGDYKMKVHLFGATSSPGCANYRLKRIATDYGEDSNDAAEFISNDFYVDDGLTNLDSIDKTSRLIKEARQMCTKGNLRLHKFVSKLWRRSHFRNAQKISQNWTCRFKICLSNGLSESNGALNRTVFSSVWFSMIGQCHVVVSSQPSLRSMIPWASLRHSF